MSLEALFLLLGLVCFVLAAFGVVVSRVNFIALGLALVVISQLVTVLGSG